MRESLEERRRHGLDDVGPLAPLNGGGVERVERLEARVGGEVTSEVWRPVLDGGARPVRPSLALAVEPEFAEIGGRALLYSPPRFEFDGSTIRAQLALGAGTSLYGAGLVAAPLLRNGRAVVFWNSDVWRYGEASPALYSSHPCALAILADGSAVGVLADSVRRGAILFASDGIEFEFEEEPFDLHVIHAEHSLEVLRRMTLLTGRAPLPPLWALGYHQSRWSYLSSDEVLAIAREFRERRIPCDALWLDIDYMHEMRSFTWDTTRFPDPAALTRELGEQGFRCVAILDPGLAVDPDYEPCASGLAGEHFVLTANGEPARGRVWPGVCHFPDFTRRETRDWWAGLVERFVRDSGIAGLWNDMNEPALFRTPLKTLPDDARHRGFGGASHARVHNLYGQLTSQATRDGLGRARADERTFVLTRASHLATAQFAAAWTGDNQSTWQDLAWSIPMVLSLGLCGQPFSGPDLGGFDGDPEPELYARWFELGAYLPFARGHSEKHACRKEPWSFGPEIETAVRAALERRMRLLPYLYTLFHAASSSGAPLARPLFFADPEDRALRNVDDAFLLGDALLVAPVIERGARARSVPLPRARGGAWYAFPDGCERLAPGTALVSAPIGTTPVFARAGSIIPLAPVKQWTGERTDAPLELHAFLDARGGASGTLYEDDGLANPPRDACLWRFEARWRRGAIELARECDGSPPVSPSPRVLVVHGAPGSSAPLRAEA